MTLSFGGTTMSSFSLLYLRLRVQNTHFYRVFIARTSIYETSLIIILLIIINNYSSAMRRLCLSGFRLLALFCCLVARHDTINNKQVITVSVQLFWQ